LVAACGVRATFTLVKTRPRSFSFAYFWFLPHTAAGEANA
jgi:hypothetical protein